MLIITTKTTLKELHVPILMHVPMVVIFDNSQLKFKKKFTNDCLYVVHVNI